MKGNREGDYDNYQQVIGEECYAEWDDEFGWYAVFGEVSGFCYESYSSKEKAEERAEQRNQNWLTNHDEFVTRWPDEEK
jgi:hypothetical protein